jgi:hypothetical protein
MLVWAGPSFRVENASAQEQIVKCEDLPDAVRGAFQSVYPKATIRECAKEVEAGKTAYEISSVDETRRDMLFYEDGSVIVVEEAIAIAALPTPVQQVVSEALADHEIKLVEKLMRDNTVSYEIQSKHAGVPLEIVFDPNGKVLKVAAASAEGPPRGAEDGEANEEKGESGEDEDEDAGN